MLKITGLYKKFQTNKTQSLPVLHNINFTVEKGQIYGIIGKSGAGKSTLMRCINLLETPDKGSIEINDIEMTTLSNSRLRQQRKNIGMIFQHFNLLASRTVFENVALSLEIAGVSIKAETQNIYKLLKLVGIYKQKDAYPHTLSGGQKQRVAIARALVNKPKILLCDEATSALDPDTTNKILQLLKQINSEFGLSILLITHEMHVIRKLCDKVAVMEHGEFVEETSVQELFANPKSNAAKTLTQEDMHMFLPKSIKQYLSSVQLDAYIPLLRLTYIGDVANKALIAKAMHEFSVNVNILQAHIEMLHGMTVGITICSITGDTKQVKDCLGFLEDKKIHIEVLGYVPSNVV
ncbi:MAG: DL-methionine transporter ATP-binding subunit [Thiotrichales bacterium]|nr:MAG: DL-methionine transporter ATP-binding subunit [Thiotrichales bacterium]